MVDVVWVGVFYVVKDFIYGGVGGNVVFVGINFFVCGDDVVNRDFVEVICGEFVFLNDNVVEYLFLVGFVEDVGFDGVFVNKMVNMYIVGLIDMMSLILILFVYGWVLVLVIEDDCVGIC